MSDWINCTLGDIAEVIGGGTPSKSKPEYYEGGTIPWITPKDLSGYPYRYIERGENNITELGLAKSSARMLPKGAVLFSSRAPIGYVAIAKNPLCTNQGFKSFICDEKKVNNLFLYYFLKSNLPMIENMANGSTFKEISGSVAKTIPISLPPLNIQEKIVSIIGSLDDKIELNLKTNETLEEMTMTLYKHWFVENGDIEKVSIEEFGSIIGGGTPKTTVAEYWDGNIPWISVKDLNSAVIIETEKKITEAGLNNSSTKLLPSFSTVLSARGTIGNISIIGKEMTMNQSCYAIKAKYELDCFVFLTLKSSINTLINQSHGSVFNTITKDTLKSLELPFNKDFAIKFEKKVKPMFLQILSNTLENKELQDIRDYLLPRLLSGEIDLSQAEKQVEEVL